MKDLKLWGIFISLIIVVQALGFFVFPALPGVYSTQAY